MRLRSTPLIMTIASSLLAGCIAVLIIFPALREIYTLNARIRTHRRALEQLYRQGQHMRSSLEEYESITHEIPLVQSSVLELGQELAFITTLEDIAARNQVQQVIHLDTAQRTPLSAQPSMPFYRVLVRLDVQGTAQHLHGLLRDWEALPAYLNVITISLSSSVANPAPASAPQLTGYLIAATYWREPSAL